MLSDIMFLIHVFFLKNSTYLALAETNDFHPYLNLLQEQAEDLSNTCIITQHDNQKLQNLSEYFGSAVRAKKFRRDFLGRLAANDTKLCFFIDPELGLSPNLSGEDVMRKIAFSYGQTNPMIQELFSAVSKHLEISTKPGEFEKINFFTLPKTSAPKPDATIHLWEKDRVGGMPQITYTEFKSIVRMHDDLTTPVYWPRDTYPAHIYFKPLNTLCINADSATNTESFWNLEAIERVALIFDADEFGKNKKPTYPKLLTLLQRDLRDFINDASLSGKLDVFITSTNPHEQLDLRRTRLLTGDVLHNESFIDWFAQFGNFALSTRTPPPQTNPKEEDFLNNWAPASGLKPS